LNIAVVGSGRSVHVMARSAVMAGRGHRVRLVTLGEVIPGAPIEVRTRRIPNTPWAAIAAGRSFLRDIREFSPDLLHLHYAGGKLATMATLSAVRPLVVTVMGGDVLPEQHPGGLPALERRATRRVLEQADLVLVKSNALRPAIERLGVRPRRVETVRWGVDPALFHRDSGAAARLRSELGLSAVDRVILSPRILRSLYNVHLIVEAMKTILSEVPRAVLLITEYAADPDYRASLERKVHEHGLGERVRFVGSRPFDEMPALYSLAEVAVSVPASDGLPQSLFEAMACEVSVVLSRLPGYAEVVSEGEHVLLADFTAQSVADAVVKLLADPELRTGLTSRSLERVRAVGLLPAEAERVEALYGELLQKDPQRARFAWKRTLDALSLLVR
jgi:glycosyltransferase involved in cell wall biosynthesis